MDVLLILAWCGAVAFFVLAMLVGVRQKRRLGRRTGSFSEMRGVFLSLAVSAVLLGVAVIRQNHLIAGG